MSRYRRGPAFRHGSTTRVAAASAAPTTGNPLRGVLRCPTCRLPQSVTHNTGRSLVYAYYTCHRCGRSEAKGGRGEAHRVRVETAHAAAGKTFGALSLPAGVAAVWREVVREGVWCSLTGQRRPWGERLSERQCVVTIKARP